MVYRPFHGGNMGSIPIGRANDFKHLADTAAISVPVEHKFQMCCSSTIQGRGETPRARSTNRGLGWDGVAPSN